MSWGTYGDGSEFNGRRKGKKGKKRKKDPFIAYFTSWIMMMHHRRTKKIEETRNHAQETESINFHPGFLVCLLPLTVLFCTHLLPLSSSDARSENILSVGGEEGMKKDIRFSFRLSTPFLSVGPP